MKHCNNPLCSRKQPCIACYRDAFNNAVVQGIGHRLTQPAVPPKPERKRKPGRVVPFNEAREN